MAIAIDSNWRAATHNEARRSTLVAAPRSQPLPVVVSARPRHLAASWHRMCRRCDALRGCQQLISCTREGTVEHRRSTITSLQVMSCCPQLAHASGTSVPCVWARQASLAAPSWSLRARSRARTIGSLSSKGPRLAMRRQNEGTLHIHAL